MALEIKTAKNSKLSKLSENCFELVGNGGWPLISIYIIFFWCIRLGWLLIFYQNYSLCQGQGAWEWHSCLWLGDNIAILAMVK
jgi:hypothetical protein